LSNKIFFWCSHFTSVCYDKDFLELDADSLVDIIGSDSLIVESEESVFNAVIQWFKFNEEDRLKHLPEVSIFLFSFFICITIFNLSFDKSGPFTFSKSFAFPCSL